jgi:iron complex outermembrane recepter protein
MINLKKLPSAIQVALFVGAASLVSGNAVAQDQDEEETTEEQATTLDRIQVTGSRIKRADVEGALPVTVIDREQLEMSGEVSVADYLRNTTFNSFGSFRPQSGSSAQSFAGISLRGLGEGRTLILIDGRRAPTAPNVGSAQDLNAIPMAAVERIEVLTDGASAIYGTDAIGGVVNIITRKDFEGVELMVGRTFPTRVGGDQEQASAVFGAAGDRGRLLGGVSYENRDIIFQRDRPWSSGGASVFSNNLLNPNGTFVANPTYGSVVPNACDFPGFSISGTGAGQRCLYDFTSSAADEAAIGLRSLFARGDYEINDNWMAYMSASVSRVKSFGRYAPVPSSPWPGGFPQLRPESPNHPGNPTGNNAGFTEGYDPTVTYRFIHRFAALGTRDANTDSNVYDINLGFEGRIGAVDVDFGVRRSEYQYYDLGRNYVVAAIAQNFIDSGAYNIYDPFGAPDSVKNAMIATISRDSKTTMDEIYGLASFDLFELAGGTAAMAIGGEYREEYYQDIYDSLSEAGQIVGSAGNSASGGRNVASAYFEALLPFMSNLEVGLAGRYDQYSDYGDDFSPKVSVRWQPLDVLTLRASWGQGFRAPSLDIVTAKPAFGAASITHAPTCIAFGLSPTCTTQVTTYSIANPNVSSEQSEQFSAGIVWDAFDWLNMSLDYYNIEITDQLAFIGVGTVLGCITGTISICPSGISTFPTGTTVPNAALGLGITFGPNGEIQNAQTGTANLGFIETDGFDFNLRTQFDLGTMGGMRNQLQITNPRSYSVNGGRNVVGDEGIPEYRANLNNTWDLGDWSFGWNVNYIHGTKSVAGRRAELGLNDYGYAHTLPSWTTHDVQATWAAPWNARITLGVQNVADKDPVQDPFDPTGRGFRFALYDGYGRIPYIRYIQNF